MSLLLCRVLREKGELLSMLHKEIKKHKTSTTTMKCKGAVRDWKEKKKTQNSSVANDVDQGSSVDIK